MKVKLQQVQGLHFRAHTPSGHTVDVDGAVAHGGTDQGPRPMELVLVSLASCSGIDVALILDKGRQPYEGLEIDVDGQRADAIPAVYEKIHVHYTATGTLAPDRLARAVRLSMEKYCSVTKMLQPDVEITWSSAVVAPDAGAVGEPEVIES